MNISVAIIMNKENVMNARKKKDTKRHLIKRIFENFQLTNAECFSDSLYNV